MGRQGSSSTAARRRRAYAVLACRPGYVTVRNPCGEDVDLPERPRRNGAFEIKVDELGRYFHVVSTVR